MPNYLKIASVSATNPIDMFTLGVSTARGVEGKIGQFGSGSLMATLLWLRLYGVSPVFSLNGVKVEFDSRPEKTTTGGIFHRVYQSIDGAETPLSVALEYGELDWTNPVMALREFVCNALDQGAAIDQCISKVSSLDCDDNQVCVFIPWSGEIQKYWLSIDQYFLHFTDRQDKVCIEKASISPCRIYRKGVFVRELGENTMFDYNLDIEINECRTGSSDSMLSLVNDVQEGCNDNAPKEYYDTIFQAILSDVECYEVTHRLNWAYSGWLATLKEQAAKGTRLRKQTELAGDNRANNGAVGYPVHNSWFMALTNKQPLLCGYPDRLAAESGIEISDATEDLQQLADECWQYLTTLLPTDKQIPKICSFVTTHGSDPSFMGKFDATQNRVLMWRECKTSRQIMLEELAHAISGCYDCTRSFQDYLFRLINEAMGLIVD